ncbi:MAG: thioredoxin domain-containing protein, partial [Acidimicrobiia bacterium]
IQEQASRLTAALRRERPRGDAAVNAVTVEAAVATIAAAHDDRWGGFTAAPKFPQAPVLELLLRWEAVGGDTGDMLRTTLTAMAKGGIYDRLGGGFARYSTDGRWLVPHFEKMLYDNALLARVYLRAWQMTGEDLFRSVAEATLDYIMGDLSMASGGLASSEDADSDGGEGRFYVFTWDEFATAAGADAEPAARVLGVSRAGNFGGTNILHSARSAEDVANELGLSTDEVATAVARVEDALATVRSHRTRPGVDDKAVTAWNGFAVRAFAEAAAVLGSERYAAQARNTARFLIDKATVGGRLMRSWRNGATSVGGFSDDYSAAAIGLLTLYEATGEEEWAAAGLRLAAELVDLFWDPDGGGFFAIGIDSSPPLHRSKDLQDNPTPGGNSLGAELMGMVGALTGQARWLEMQAGALQSGAYIARNHPLAAGHLLAVAATVPTMKEVALVGAGKPRQDLADAVWESFRPDCVLAWGPGDAGLIPLLAGREPVGDAAAAYVCRDFTCDAPVIDATSLRRRLRAQPRHVPQR